MARVCVAVADRERGDRAVDVLGEGLEPAGHGPLRSPGTARIPLRGIRRVLPCPRCAGRMRKDSMRERIKTAMTTVGIILKILPITPGDEEQRCERGDGREDGKGDGDDHLPRGEDCGIEWRVALGHERIGPLAHDDRVVDDHAEGHDEREERDHVDREVRASQDQKRAEEGDRDPQADPKGEPQIHEQREDHHDEGQAHARVAQQQIDALAQALRVVGPDIEGDLGW